MAGPLPTPFHFAQRNVSKPLYRVDGVEVARAAGSPNAIQWRYCGPRTVRSEGTRTETGKTRYTGYKVSFELPIGRFGFAANFAKLDTLARVGA